jgi:hypothetical protein
MEGDGVMSAVVYVKEAFRTEKMSADRSESTGMGSLNKGAALTTIGQSDKGIFVKDIYDTTYFIRFGDCNRHLSKTSPTKKATDRTSIHRALDAALDKRPVTDGALTITAILSALLAYYLSSKADNARNIESGYNLNNYKPEPRSF